MTEITTNDTQTQASAPVSAPPTQAKSSPAPARSTQPSSKAKSKAKPRRARQRRRAAASEHDSSGDEAGAARSDSSLSSRSDAGVGSDSEDDEAEEASAPRQTANSTSKAKKTPVFADVSSITPAGWAKKEGEDVQQISFEDFSAGKQPTSATAPTRGTGMSIRGRGKGKVEPAPKREYTPEETAKWEAQKAKRKEKTKAKRAALKEEKIKASTTEATAKAAVNDEAKTSQQAEGSSGAVPPAASSQSVPKPSKAKGKKRTGSSAAPEATAVDDLATSTSALTLDAPAKTTTSPATPSTSEAPTTDNVVTDTPAEDTAANASGSQQRPPRQPRNSTTRDAYAQRVAEDPKFTPRVGQFWTHDQRLYEAGNVGDGYTGLRQMSPFWRGRAMPRGAFRGGFRGRGRGGFFPNARGGFVNGASASAPRPVELSQEEGKEEGGSKLAMDREYELAEAREKARADSTTAAAPVEEEGAAEHQAQAAPVPPSRPAAERKWGHEGYEAMSAPEQLRGGFRGRVRGARGRGGFFGRGGHLPLPSGHQRFTPAAAAVIAARAASASPAATSVSAAPSASATATATAATSAALRPVADDREKMSTQPTADSLLDPADESVKIRFPGSETSVVPAASSPSVSFVPPPVAVAAQSDAPASTPTSAAAVAADPSSAPVPAQPSSQEPQFPSLQQSGSPAPVAAVQAQMYTGGSNNSPFPVGSENGSVGSGQFVQHHPAQFYQPTGMAPNGEFVPSAQRPTFYPQQSPRVYPAAAQGAQFYPPQSPYSPGPYDQQQQHRGSFSGAPISSPQGIFYPVAAANGYANGRSSPLNPYMNQVGGYFAPARGSNKVAIRAPNAGAQTPNSEPTADVSSGDHAQVQANGGAYYAQHYNPYVQPFVPGQRQEAVYYTAPNGQPYAWQGYGEQAYYDGNATYGY